jgi:hypothetical protein
MNVSFKEQNWLYIVSAAAVEQTFVKNVANVSASHLHFHMTLSFPQVTIPLIAV